MGINIVSELRTMAGNAPARPAYVTDLYARAADEIESLRARLEKAEAERGASRNDALKEAAQAVEALLAFEANTGDRQRFMRKDIEMYRKGSLRLAMKDIRRLKKIEILGSAALQAKP